MTETESKESNQEELISLTEENFPVKEKKIEHSAEELKELLQRTQANFENYRKQMEKRFQEIRNMAARKIILQILPVIDNFELALKQEQKGEEFVKGMELIYSQLNDILEHNQIKIIETKQQRFDPYLHEALLKVDSEQPEDQILEEFQRGFTLQGEVIRHAKVKVSSGKRNQPTMNINETKNKENSTRKLNDKTLEE